MNALMELDERGAVSLGVFVDPFFWRLRVPVFFGGALTQLMWWINKQLSFYTIVGLKRCITKNDVVVIYSCGFPT